MSSLDSGAENPAGDVRIVGFDSLAPTWSPGKLKRLLPAAHRSHAMKPRQAKFERSGAFVKPMYEGVSCDCLVCEYVISLLSAAFRICTPRCGIVKLDRLQARMFGQPTVIEGSAFVSEEVAAGQWNGDGRDLSTIKNLDEISRLIVFDTWVLNRDRFCPSGRPVGINNGPHQNFANVLVAGKRGQRRRMYAIDHGHAITYGEPIDVSIIADPKIKDSEVLGLFPGFREHVSLESLEQAVEDLKHIDPNLIAKVINLIPADWEFAESQRGFLADFLLLRAQFVPTILIDSVRREALTQLSTK